VKPLLQKLLGSVSKVLGKAAVVLGTVGVVITLGQASSHDEAEKAGAELFVGSIVARVLGPIGTPFIVGSVTGAHVMSKYMQGIDRVVSEGLDQASKDPAMLKRERPQKIIDYFFGK
jgi:hypothetical protein